MRTQFTFYRSYYEAIKHLLIKDRVSVLMAICAYALDEEDPTLTDVAAAVFTLIRPTLDTGRKKSEIGKRGGEAKKQPPSKPQAKTKQSLSKAEANRKQPLSEKEREKEKEKEGEIEKEREKENECSPPIPPFDEFWEAYPRKVGKADAKKAFCKIPAEAIPRLVSAVNAQKLSQQWQKENGQYIPNPATWLNQGRWDDELGQSGTSNPFLKFLHDGGLDDDG